MQEVIQKIKSEIPHGFQKEVAEKYGISPTYLSKFLNGKVNSRRLLKVVADEFLGYKNQQKELLQKLEA